MKEVSEAAQTTISELTAEQCASVSLPDDLHALAENVE